MEVKRPENEHIAAYREKNGSKPRGNLQGFFSRRAEDGGTPGEAEGCVIQRLQPWNPRPKAEDIII